MIKGTSNEVAEAWRAGNHAEGTTRSRNFWFENGKLYSYRTMIAFIVPGTQICFRSTYRYSATTSSKHQSKAWLNEGINISVETTDTTNPAELMRQAIKELTEFKKTIYRKQSHFYYYLSSYNKTLAGYQEACKTLKLPPPPLQPLRNYYLFPLKLILKQEAKKVKITDQEEPEAMREPVTFNAYMLPDDTHSEPWFLPITGELVTFKGYEQFTFCIHPMANYNPKTDTEFKPGKGFSTPWRVSEIITGRGAGPIMPTPQAAKKAARELLRKIGPAKVGEAIADILLHRGGNP